MNIPCRAMAVLTTILAMGSVHGDPAQELAAWQQEQEQALLQNGSAALEQMRVQPQLNLAVDPLPLPGESYVQLREDSRKSRMDCESAQLVLLPDTEPALVGGAQKLLIQPGDDAVFSVLICKTL